MRCQVAADRLDYVRRSRHAAGDAAAKRNDAGGGPKSGALALRTPRQRTVSLTGASAARADGEEAGQGEHNDGGRGGGNKRRGKKEKRKKQSKKKKKKSGGGSSRRKKHRRSRQ